MIYYVEPDGLCSSLEQAKKAFLLRDKKIHAYNSIEDLCIAFNNDYISDLGQLFYDNEGFFIVSRVHRDDLENVGLDGDNVDDGTMEAIADDMHEDYCTQLFHESLKIIAADKYNIPKKEYPLLDELRET